MLNDPPANFEIGQNLQRVDGCRSRVSGQMVETAHFGHERTKVCATLARRLMLDGLAAFFFIAPAPSLNHPSTERGFVAGRSADAGSRQATRRDRCARRWYRAGF